MVGDPDLRFDDLGAGREAGRAGLRAQREIAPRFGKLRHLEGRVPTPHGLIEVKLDREGGGEIVIPDGVTAVVRLRRRASHRRRIRRRAASHLPLTRDRPPVRIGRR